MTMTTTTLERRDDVFSDPEPRTLAGFLGGYSGLTRDAYSLDLRQFVQWTQTRHLALFDVARADIEGFARHLEDLGRARRTISRRLCTITCFYRYAVEEGLLDRSPAVRECCTREQYPGDAKSTGSPSSSTIACSALAWRVERIYALKRQPVPEGGPMSWNIEGFYVENCNCDAICPCTWSNLTKAATYDDCRATLAFRVERGDVEGVDVGGRTIVLALQTPKLMVDGNWKAGLLFDRDTSDAQMEALTKVMTGALGGPMAGLAPLITQFLGAQRTAIALESGAGGWSLTVADDASLTGSTLIGPETSEPVALHGITAHPAGPTLTVTPSGEMRSALFGIEFGGSDRSGFSAPFAWAA